MIHAKDCQRFFEAVKENAEQIGNDRKGRKDPITMCQCSDRLQSEHLYQPPKRQTSCRTGFIEVTWIYVWQAPFRGIPHRLHKSQVQKTTMVSPTPKSDWNP